MIPKHCSTAKPAPSLLCNPIHEKPESKTNIQIQSFKRSTGVRPENYRKANFSKNYIRLQKSPRKRGFVFIYALKWRQKIHLCHCLSYLFMIVLWSIPAGLASVTPTRLSLWSFLPVLILSPYCYYAPSIPLPCCVQNWFVPSRNKGFARIALIRITSTTT